MEGQPAESSLDLSHLTEAEQAKILQVLQRDLDLRLHDEGRVRSEVTAPPPTGLPVVQCDSDPPTCPLSWTVSPFRAAGCSRRRRRTRGCCAPCRGPGSPRSATSATTPGRAARSCTPPSATREQRAEVRAPAPHARRERGSPLMPFCACCYSNGGASDSAVQR